MAAFAAVAGQALQMGGDLMSGMNQAAGYETSANASELNARTAELQGDQARAAAASDELRERRQNAQRLGEQRAAFGESGFDPSSGSAIDVQQQSARNAEMNALQLRYEGMLRGNAYDSQAGIFRYQAKGYRTQASSAKTAAWMKLFGKGLSAAGSMGGGAGAAGGASSAGSFMDAGSSASSFGSMA